MLALHDPSEQLHGHGRLWVPQPYSNHDSHDITLILSMGAFQ